MNGAEHLHPTAALLERAYRLALVLQGGPAHDAEAGGFVAAELVEVLDEARVSLMQANEAVQRVSCAGRTSETSSLSSARR